MRASQAVLAMKRIEARGVLASRRFLLRLRAETLSDFRGHRRIAWPESMTAPLVELLTDATTVAYLRGAEASRVSGRKKTIAASVFDDTLQNLAELQGYSLPALQKHFSVESRRLLDQVFHGVEEALNSEVAKLVSTGTSVKEAVKVLGDTLNAAGLGQSPHKLESLFRTQTAVAYGAGRWDADQDPAIQEILWGYEYVTAGDDRVRPEHEALDGVTLPKDDPFWQKFWPPNGWNCRCVALPVYKDEAPVSRGPPSSTSDGGPVEPDPGFAANAGARTSVSSTTQTA